MCDMECRKTNKHHDILSVDPGNKFTAYSILDTSTCHPIEFGKLSNDEMRDVLINYIKARDSPIVIIETMMSMGMPVGSEVFDTCIFIGRLTELAESIGAEVRYITRRQEKLTLCGTMKSKDKDIRRALINRYAEFDFKNGKGTKKNPDTYYGVASDCWSSCAVGTTWVILNKEKEQ